MHLAFIIPSLITAGGSERAISELANYFAGRSSFDNKVSIITLSSPTEKPFYTLDPRINIIQINQLNSLNQPNKSSICYRFKKIIKRILCLRHTIKNLKPDLIISFIEITNITTLLASLNLKIPVIVSERTSPAHYIIPKFYQWLRLKTYPWAKKIIVQTASSAGYFPDHLQKLIKIIPNAVKQQSQLVTLNKSVTNIVCVGRLDINKDYQTLIRATKKILLTVPNLTVTIYGEGPYRETLENLIRSINAADNINLSIQLPGAVKDIISAIAKADLFISPSRYEGFPNALCEAMAVGLPVIASNCSGNIDIVQDRINGRLFPIGDVDALTVLIKELIDDYQQREQLSINARKITEQFSEQLIYTMWEKVITS